MREKREQIEPVRYEKHGQKSSVIDLWRLAKAVPDKELPDKKMSPDSMLAVYGNRATYTFIIDGEVASIHFDLGKKEIFFKGHNIKYLRLTSPQMEALWHMRAMLEKDQRGRVLLSEYEATLGRYIADNNKGERAYRRKKIK